MDQWIHTMVAQLERTAQDVEKAVDQWFDGTMDATDRWIEQTTQAVEKSLDPWRNPELEAQMQRTVETWLEQTDRIALALETQADQWVGQTEQQLQTWIRPVTQPLDAMANGHTACIGCRNYCGEVYGGNMLVCGIHPYGCGSDRCPDHAPFS